MNRTLNYFLRFNKFDITLITLILQYLENS